MQPFGLVPGDDVGSHYGPGRDLDAIIIDHLRVYPADQGAYVKADSFFWAPRF